MASAAEVTGLYLSRQSTLEQINCALDIGDRRQFRIWCKRHASLTARITSLLLALATKE